MLSRSLTASYLMQAKKQFQSKRQQWFGAQQESSHDSDSEPKKAGSAGEQLIFSPMSPEGVKEESETQSSAQTITGIWNAMMGAVIFSMPWAFELAGVWLGVGILVVILCISALASDFVMRHLTYLNKEDLSDAVEIVLGKKGYILTQVLCMIGLFGSLMALFVYMSNCLIGIVGAIQFWSNSEPVDLINTPFSYLLVAALLISLFMWILTIPEGQTFYIKLISGGVIFSVCNMIFVATMEIRSMMQKDQNEHSLVIQETNSTIPVDTNNSTTQITEDSSINLQFLTLAALCGAAFGIQPIICQITKSNKIQENNCRDMIIGYIFVGASYLIVGVLGFLGYGSPLYPSVKIAENITAMFDPTDILSFLIRIFLLFQVACIYPFQLVVLRLWSFTLFGNFEPTPLNNKMARFVLISWPAFISIVYPNVGSIMAIFGSLASLWLTFCAPTILHISCTNPQTNPEMREKLILRRKQGPAHHIKDQKTTYGSHGSWLAWSILYSLIPTLGLVICSYQIIGQYLI